MSEVTAKLETYLHADGSPQRLCRNCEHFDGGGIMLATGQPKHVNGDCLNRLLPRFQTNADETCPVFYPDTCRWPDGREDD